MKQYSKPRIRQLDMDRIKAIAKAFNIPDIDAVTKVLDTFEQSGKRSKKK